MSVSSATDDEVDVALITVREAMARRGAVNPLVQAGSAVPPDVAQALLQYATVEEEELGYPVLEDISTGDDIDWLVDELERLTSAGQITQVDWLSAGGAGGLEEVLLPLLGQMQHARARRLAGAGLPPRA